MDVTASFNTTKVGRDSDRYVNKFIISTIMQHTHFLTAMHETHKGHIFIKAFYTWNNILKEGKFILDTGSTCCFLLEGLTTLETDLDSYQTEDTSIYQSQLQINDYICRVNWNNWNEESMITYPGISGILGIDFMLQNKLVIDFRNQLIYAKSVGDLKNSTKDLLYYPIHFGIRNCSLPVVGISGKNSTYCSLIDTGSCVNVIKQNILSEGDFAITSAPAEHILLTGIHESTEVEQVQVRFQIPAFKGKSRCLCHATFQDNFCVLSPSTNLIPRNIRFHTDAILGKEFLKHHNWIIDFDKGYMYL